ncbi:MAG: hypothetical protein FWC28_06310 [Proteobacteria bacterium]|nr:hypothetical protein [Cystobacterineae bacterium]MCL2258848.1 hypothetical protein [Cystobacterineae bacterium]MCL2314846.1 hypothetical protein [Pseudomonadota bacterium]
MNFLLPLALLLLAQPNTPEQQQPPITSEYADETEPVGYLIESPNPPNHVPLIGLRLDSGFPDGIGLDFLGHPLPFLQLHFGLLTDLLGVGLRGGASFIPWHGTFRPVLTLEAGHHFNGASWVFPRSFKPELRDFLSSIQYTFFNHSIGFDVGSANIAFVFRLGGSLVFFKSSSFSQRLDEEDDSTVYVKKVRARGYFPTIKFGISICFL